MKVKGIYPYEYMVPLSVFLEIKYQRKNNFIAKDDKRLEIINILAHYYN